MPSIYLDQSKPWNRPQQTSYFYGKPKIVSQTYFGRADKILEKLRAGPVPAQPREAVVREFGASTALLTLARRLRLVEHIDRRVARRARLSH